MMTWSGPSLKTWPVIKTLAPVNLTDFGGGVGGDDAGKSEGMFGKCFTQRDAFECDEVLRHRKVRGDERGDFVGELAVLLASGDEVEDGDSDWLGFSECCNRRDEECAK